MPKDNLPTYVIVELLIRLTPYNAFIGDYKNHTIYDEGVMVKTSQGTIHLPKSLIADQFASPELVNDKTLADIASSFKPFRPVI